LCKDLLHPKHIPIWLKPLSPAARLLTNQWLPERLCKENGLKITNFDRAMYHYFVGYISMALSALASEGKDKSEQVLSEGFEEGSEGGSTTECGLGQT
jgi:hypothetical protein